MILLCTGLDGFKTTVSAYLNALTTSSSGNSVSPYPDPPNPNNYIPPPPPGYVARLDHINVPLLWKGPDHGRQVNVPFCCHRWCLWRPPAGSRWQLWWGRNRTCLCKHRQPRRTLDPVEIINVLAIRKVVKLLPGRKIEYERDRERE